MDFRIEKKDSFKIIGYNSRGGWDDWMYFIKQYDDILRNSDGKY